MVLLALSAVFSAFGVEVLAFSLAEAEGGVRKAPGLATGSTLCPKIRFCLLSSQGLRPLPATVRPQGKDSPRGRRPLGSLLSRTGRS